MRRIGLALGVSGAVLGLAACNGSDAPEEDGTFEEQELLERSVTDEMLPYGVVNAGEDVPEDEPEEGTAGDSEEEPGPDDDG